MNKQLSDQEFLTFCEFVYQQTGLRFDVTKRYFVDRRLSECIEETGSSSFKDYFQNLQPLHSQQRQRLINRLTVNETSFLREAGQLQCLTEHLLPEILQQHADSPGGNRHCHDGEFSIWCIPCSTGEEPYSVSIYLREHFNDFQPGRLRLMASDINTEVLELARQGQFKEHTLRKLPTAWIKKYFTQLGNFRKISDEIRSEVHFTRVNLNSQEDMAKINDIDIIFCRNLLIYFDETARRKAAEKLFRSLAPGGFLCLGHSESLSQFQSYFVTRKFGDTYVLQKPLS